ncbi:uncharacterized protein LOC123271780 [Cotesia glomerata]|uniref:Brinker DNA-binding domain-containing protein n=1 Tax=Cotesia glomerata TaxID=32391 RepID=A0AAV7IRS0_COTGL|nr:uncharacterized protein LOC123271780 [Cotesia glomerata]KAH0557274.1 hypothetical protein KQX54_002673 [Cotesia glomerata]
MAHGVVKSEPIQNSQPEKVLQKKTVVTGSRRIFPASFKIKVLDSYRNDKDCLGNQRATARKYGIHRRQIQKWLQCEQDLRNSCANSNSNSNSNNTSGSKPGIDLTVRIQEIPRLPLVNEDPKYCNWNYENYRSEPSVYSGYSADNERVSPDSTSTIGSEREDFSSECKKSADSKFGSIRILIGSDDRNSSKPTDCLIRNNNGSDLVKPYENYTGSKDFSRNLMKSNESSNESIIECNSRILTKPNESLIDNRVPSNGMSNQEYPIIPENIIGTTITNKIGLINNGMTQNYCRYPTSTRDSNYNIRPDAGSPIVSNSIKKIMGLDSNLNRELELDSYSDSGSHSQSDSEDQLDSSVELRRHDITRRRSFPLGFKLQVLDNFHQNDENQRATARRFRINRRQVQKWLAQEKELREEVALRRGEARQRLTSAEPSPGPVDLRTYGFAYQDRPLCLVMPKNNPKPKKDYITFKPYLDNPVVKPDEQRNENTCYCLQVPAWGFYQDGPSAFVRYPVPYL